MFQSPIECQYPMKEYLHNAFNNLLADYLRRHSKVMPVRFDLHYPKNEVMGTTNTDISRFIAKVVQRFKRAGLDPAYAWVREQAGSHNPHYHCLLLLNGHKTRSSNMVFNVAEQLWGSTIGRDARGLVIRCNKNRNGEYQTNGDIIHRQGSFPHVERQIGYMAKPGGKGEALDGLRDFGMSRLPSFSSGVTVSNLDLFG